MQLQHANHLDVNQNQFSCQNKNKADRTFFLSHKEAFLVLINYSSNFFKGNPYKYYTLLQLIMSGRAC